MQGLSTEVDLLIYHSADILCRCLHVPMGGRRGGGGGGSVSTWSPKATVFSQACCPTQGWCTRVLHEIQSP